MKTALARTLGLCLLACSLAATTDDSAKLPVVDVADAAALQANLDKDVFLKGTVKSATWSDTGKVMNISFNGAEQTGVQAIAFAQVKNRLDAAFNGDAAKTLSGAKVRIRGRLREYSARQGQKGHPEVTISDPSQITIEIDNG